MIEATNISKRYGSHLAVDDVGFSIEKGEVVGLLGPNGAGKSTIMNILTGYLSLNTGKVVIDGFDISENPESAKKRIGYLPEIPPLYIDMTVREYLNFIYNLKRVRFPKKAHIDEIMRLVGVDGVQNRLIKNLSKGYRQRVGFAQALVGNPDVLILDEPTVGLDPKQIIEIRSLIEKLGRNHTIIVSSHILSEIQAVCRRVIIINKGQIIADDTPDNLSAALSSDRSLAARIEGDEEEISEALKTVLGVKSVSPLGSKEKGAYDFIITPEDGCDIRADIFRKVADIGGALLSLSSNEMTLEQIFLRLTDAADNDEARRLLGIGNSAREEISDTDKEAEIQEETEEEQL